MIQIAEDDYGRTNNVTVKFIDFGRTKPMQQVRCCDDAESELYQCYSDFQRLTFIPSILLLNENLPASFVEPFGEAGGDTARCSVCGDIFTALREKGVESKYTGMLDAFTLDENARQLNAAENADG